MTAITATTAATNNRGVIFTFFIDLFKISNNRTLFHNFLETLKVQLSSAVIQELTYFCINSLDILQW